MVTAIQNHYIVLIRFIKRAIFTLKYRDWRSLALTAFFKWCGLQQGQLLPWWALIIGSIVFPGRGMLMLFDRFMPYKYSFEADTLEIDGVKFCLRSFENFAHSPAGTLFRVVKNENGVLIIEILSEEQPKCPKA